MGLLGRFASVAVSPGAQPRLATRNEDLGHYARALAEDHRREEGCVEEGERRAGSRGGRGKGYHEHLPCVPFDLQKLIAMTDAEGWDGAVKANMAAEEKEKMTDEEILAQTS